MRPTLLASSLLLGLSVVASAQTSFSSAFDAPTYATGTLAGQDGWIAGSGVSNLPTVSNANSLSSTQSVSLSYPGTGSAFASASHAFVPGAVTADTALLKASADIFVQNIAGADRYFGIGFGIGAGTSATNGFLGIALGGNGLRGGGGSYASYNGLTTGQLQARSTADYFGRWINVSLVADRSLTTNNVTFTFSGLGTAGGTATQTFTKSVNLATAALTHVQLFTDYGSTSTVQGSAFVDNVSFSAGPVAAVPEPATLAALGLGAAALLRRRRK